RRKRPTPATPSLFDQTPSTEEAPADTAPAPAPAASTAPSTDDEASAWVQRVLAAPEVVDRRRNPRIRLTDDQLRRLLGVLEAAGTMPIPHTRLAQEAKLPPSRINGYVAQLQEIGRASCRERAWVSVAAGARKKTAVRCEPT